MHIDSRVDQAIQRLRAAGAPIQSGHNIALIPKLEALSGLRLPRTFHSLISRYSFQLLEFEQSELFGNNSQSEYDLSVTPYRDHHLSDWLLKNRLFHIGFPHIGNYDPICLDLFDSPDLDSSVVQLDHEDILLERDVKVIVLSSSFLDFIESQHVA